MTWYPDYMNVFEVMNSVRFGNKLAHEIDAKNKPTGFRFEAAIRHCMTVSSRRDAVNMAHYFHAGPTKPHPIDCVSHINRLAHTQSIYRVPEF